METIISVCGRNINVRVREHRIAITNNDELAALLAKDKEVVTDKLISLIKRNYYNFFKKDFGVSDSSFSIEIWGHVYMDKFAEAVKSISSIALIDNIAEKIILQCDEINVGEKGYDKNRFIWDGLSFLKSEIASTID